MGKFIDIPYSELVKAVKSIEKKKGICKYLPCGRFIFDRVNDLRPTLDILKITNEDGCNIRFDLIVCDGKKMGGKNTGTAAGECRNCVIRKCKHKNTKIVKCNTPDCSKKEHIKCLDCGTYVDLLLDRERLSKKLMKNIKESFK